MHPTEQPLQFRPRQPARHGLHAQGITVVFLAVIGLLGFFAVSAYTRSWAWSTALPFLVASLVAGGNALAILAGRNPPWWLRWAPLPVFVATIKLLIWLR
jgi:hypothetical protein